MNYMGVLQSSPAQKNFSYTAAPVNKQKESKAIRNMAFQKKKETGKNDVFG
jgi:hypothetical protein